MTQPGNNAPDTPAEVNQIHRYSDVDSGLQAQHHTLGREDNQATSGAHVHNGRDSAVLPSYSRTDHEHTVDGSLAIPTGTVVMWAGSGTSLPTGWALCNGQAISRTLFPTLFGIIGTTYGTGDGSTTYNLPNFISKFPQGATTVNLGGTGGSTTSSTQPDHSHGNVSTGSVSHGHTASSGSTGTDSSHSHTLAASADNGNSATTGTGFYAKSTHGHTVSGGSHNHTGPTITVNNEATHQHPMSTTNNGGSHSHTLTPVYLNINYMIRTG